MSSDPSPPGDATSLIVRTLRIDRSSPVPLWFQAAQGMENLIARGELPPGSRLDNEVLLSEKLNLSRPTMRRALEHLVGHGMLVRRRGVGTRVVQPKVRRPLGLTSLFDDLAESGQQPRTRVLTNEVVPASSAVAQALELEEGADVIHLVRMRTAGDQPIAKLTNYLPVELVELSTDDVERTGLYELLRSAGVMLHSATQTIGARKATAEEARLLNEPRGAALLTMQRNTYDDHARPVEHGTHVYAASRYSFQTELLSPS
jgi:GntR family transcriptional regulator